MNTLSAFDAHQLVYDLEEKNNLLQFKVDGWCIWPLLRWDFIATLTGQKIIPEKVKWPASYLAQIIFDDLRGLTRIPKAKTLIVTKDLNLRELDGETFRDIFFDELLDQMDNYLKVETLHAPTFFPSRRKAHIKSKFSLTLFRKIPALLAAWLNLGDIADTAKSMSHILAPYVDEERFKFTRLKCEFTQFYLSKHLFGWLLDRIHPKVIMLVNTHGYASLAAAAKERNIQLIELQHGIVFKYHPCYSWTSFARHHKRAMPIPDIFLLYGEFWKDVLTENRFWDEELYIVGSPRIDRFRSEAFPKGNLLKLVVTTQPLVYPSVYCDFFQKFIKLAEGKFDFEITFKLHMREMNKDAYQQCFIDVPNVKVVLNNENPSTFELIKTADLHLSITSTCHYEALALGTPTLILPFKGLDAMAPLLENGYSALCESPEKLIDLITKQQIRPVDPQISAYFFKPKAVENILNLLSSLDSERDHNGNQTTQDSM
ncbi:MAG TPA: hypothetical protein PKM21_00795 [Anaerolineales bacterium]|nr:hypothetical protein [Anaerolineales bacterium]